MLASLLDIMRCPVCDSGLRITKGDTGHSSEIVEGEVACQEAHSWGIVDGVLAFSREDAASDPWSKSFREYDRFLSNKRWALTEFGSQTNRIISQIPKNSQGPYLDICTGDGSLLFNLMETLGGETQVISLDMSLHLQTFNRRYSTETYPNRLDGFVSCDASTLPFKDGVLPCVVGFGISNMMSKMAQGVSEVARVLEDGGVFIFTHMFVDEDSEGWRLLREAIGASDSDCGFLGLEEHFESLMASLDFSNTEIEVVEEIVGDPRRDVESGPIFPYPNEKQRKLLVTARK